MDSKKIGIDARLWKQTGIGRYIRNLVSGLLDLDSKNQYILFCRPEDLDSIKNHVSSSKYNKNVTFIEAGIKWHSISEQIEFPRLLNKYNLDLVHFPYFSVPVFYNKPFVVTVHDLIINHFPTGRASTLPLPFYKLKRMGYEYVLRKAVQNAKVVIAPSNATREEILDHYIRPAESKKNRHFFSRTHVNLGKFSLKAEEVHKVSKNKIFVTPEGIDSAISDFKPVLFKPKNPYFLYVGNAYPHKNLERFLEAFKVFMDNGGDTGFGIKLAGRQDFFYKKLKDYVRKNKIEGVEFLGYVEDADLASLYSQAKATFVPSLMEGFGLTALEAMNMGSVVVCSKIPSLEEVCGESAQYFDPKDLLSIAQAMRKVTNLSEKERLEIVKKAKKHVDTFSWAHTAKLTLDVYNSCL